MYISNPNYIMTARIETPESGQQYAYARVMRRTGNQYDTFHLGVYNHDEGEGIGLATHPYTLPSVSRYLHSPYVWYDVYVDNLYTWLYSNITNQSPLPGWDWDDNYSILFTSDIACYVDEIRYGTNTAIPTPIIDGDATPGTNTNEYYSCGDSNWYDYDWIVTGPAASITGGSETDEISVMFFVPGTYTIKCKVQTRYGGTWSSYGIKTVVAHI